MIQIFLALTAVAFHENGCGSVSGGNAFKVSIHAGLNVSAGLVTQQDWTGLSSLEISLDNW